MPLGHLDIRQQVSSHCIYFPDFRYIVTNTHNAGVQLEVGVVFQHGQLQGCRVGRVLPVVILLCTRKQDHRYHWTHDQRKQTCDVSFNMYVSTCAQPVVP